MSWPSTSVRKSNQYLAFFPGNSWLLVCLDQLAVFLTGPGSDPLTMNCMQKSSSQSFPHHLSLRQEKAFPKLLPEQGGNSLQWSRASRQAEIFCSLAYVLFFTLDPSQASSWSVVAMADMVTLCPPPFLAYFLCKCYSTVLLNRISCPSSPTPCCCLSFSLQLWNLSVSFSIGQLQPPLTSG